MDKDGVYLAVEITKQQAGSDPEITIFHVAVQMNDGEWTETMPTAEHLNILLRGIEIGLASRGLFASSLHWGYGANWSEPTRVRYLIREHGLIEREEYLSDGQLAEI